MAIRKSVIYAALRIGKLREQSAAAKAQRSLRALNEAVGAANQLEAFASDYRRDAAQLVSLSTVDLALILSTKTFADKLDDTAVSQRQLMQPLREQVDFLTKEHYAVKRRLEGVEKIASRIRQEEISGIMMREAREVEDSFASRLSRARDSS
jgi:flagellar biosynthesis chaperone FliJ